jgi:hypothetical protein
LSPWLRPRLPDEIRRMRASCLPEADHVLGVKGLWIRRRPEYWYGVAWLPVFWVTVALGIGLGWNVWRDRRALRTS